MSEQETFLSRWLRLKQDSSAATVPDRAEPAPGQAAMDETSPGEDGLEEVLQETDVPAPADFDPACLPPVETLTADSDISLFLRPGVPAELMHAALRAVWVADPAIRDFIGIAENQWDFNDPTALPGFGPLEATDNVQRLAAQAVSQSNIASESMARMSDFVERHA